uniref:Uncharacterized protein n=1 Tax=Otolemur garnettii TaxID=30611 RepID=H0XL69_OTOGA
MKTPKERGEDEISEEEDLPGTSFSAKTNPGMRDEEAGMPRHMRQTRKRKRIMEREVQKVRPKKAGDCLYKHLENVLVSSAKKTEEMFNQTLSGIPGAYLGAKIGNIISTEDAKAGLLADQQNKKDSETSFVPPNMAVNYVQHCRSCHVELNGPTRRNKEPKGADLGSPLLTASALLMRRALRTIIAKSSRR